MSIDNRIVEFIKEALQKNMSRHEIEQILIQAGWARGTVREALALFAPIDCPVPVPKPRSLSPARDAFFYLVIFSTLYTSTISFTHLIFSAIDRIFDTTVRFSHSFAEETRSDLSALIIALPIFLVVSYWETRLENRDTDRRTSDARKMLTYLTLFLTASVIIVDLIWLVYRILESNLPLSFALKVFTIAFLYSSIFWHYFREMRKADSDQ